MMNKIAREATQLASSYFENNLLLSFIGGSYARRVARKDSDIDLFVVLKKSDREKEIEFALAFKQFHEKNQLNFSHCGEIFNKITLESLIDYTIKFLPMLVEIQYVGCYHGDCIFSIFRKGDIVLKFFEEPKIHIIGDFEYLKSIEVKAKKFFSDFPMKRIQLEKGNIRIENSKIKQHEMCMSNLIQSDRFIDTPIGVGLERWFHKDSINNIIYPSYHTTICKARFNSQSECPLNYYPKQSYENQLYKDQCLASFLIERE